MRTLLIRILTTGCVLFGAVASSANETTPNLVRDGGMERWREVSPGTVDFNRFKRIEGSYTDEGAKLMPSAYEQGSVSVAKMETADVFSGKRALRLKATRFYMHGASHGAYNARPGDVFVVRYMVKGAGAVTMHFAVYGGLGQFRLEQKGKPVPDKWTRIEQRILIGGNAPGTIYPRLDTFGNEMLIDDVFVGRVLREAEQTQAKKVPRQYDERVAFASEATQAPVVDGRLDEKCWEAAVPFSGFRLSHEQTLLAPQQASFRALYDETAIYLGIELMLPDPQRILSDLRTASANQDRSGDFYTDRHSVEVFIQPPGQVRYVQYVISLDGCCYDGVGMEKSWDGKWKHAVSVGDDRWFLEMMVPAGDLELDKIPAAEGWRLNVVDNKDGNYSIWSAVGNNFHTPFNFGALVTRGFPKWCTEKLQTWTGKRAKAAAQSHKLGLQFADRLKRAEEFSKTLATQTAGEQSDWEQITRTYALMNFVDTVYRVMDAEIAYAQFFSEQ